MTSPGTTTRPYAADDEHTSPPGRTALLRRGAAALAVLASAAVLAVGAVSYATSDDDAAVSFAQGRDQALVAGTDAVATLNTLDHTELREGLDRWGAVTTGSLHEDLARLGPTDRKALAAAGATSTGTVLRAGLTSLDLRAGKARGIFLVEVQVTESGGTTSTKRNRLQGDLLREDGTWRLSGLTPITVGAS